ncbi:alkyl sulfatase dimerization domain-containing protein [Iamia sp.]|uniref:alkyl sulfatase dimerization domain-containing protein n=1 Tax=Iamia sp. TaxID=2722710 RepID=UPI002C35892F|nr:alkyl sulfatase dimerization domain-containing protein [Iamia sp.]HXH59268.1 alkyl sulfatase dimerization domain-containing protein [Iamia sp.]
MADLLALSSGIIDSGDVDTPTNRVTQELSEVGDGIAVVESFSHSVALRTDDGLVVFDASSPFTGAAVVDALRAWSTDPVDSLVYTHGHLDHVGGSPAFVADAEGRGDKRPRFIAHDAVPARFARYRDTDGYNSHINNRQFGGIGATKLRIGGDRAHHFLPDDTAAPDVTYETHLALNVGGTDIELHHGRGETDDHTWSWIPSHRAIACGDFLIWNYPNAGNPQKVQRYPAEWAACLRQMAALEPELLLPAHGLPIEGKERIARVFDDVATTLEDLVARVVGLMNDGVTLDEIVHSVHVPDETLAKPYLRPMYDEPEFVVRNIWRLYGGWWDGNPARLKPAPDSAIANEVATLAGGAAVLARRATETAEAGGLRLACQLVEWAGDAAPDDRDIHAVRQQLYERRRTAETSLMAKGIFAAAARDSAPIVDG